MKLISSIKLLVFAVLACMFLKIFAHEYVMIASKFMVNKGDTIDLHLFVADGFNIDAERTLQKAKTKKFDLINEKGINNLLEIGNEGDIPVAKTKIDFNGLGLFNMTRDYSYISLSNEDFKNYLKEDHIENIKIDQSKPEQREAYSRYIKCLVQSNKKNYDTLYKYITGNEFEIIFLNNPYDLKIGDKLNAKIIFRGKPLAGKTITARNRIGSKPCTKQVSRTNANGECSFTINRKGDWFLHVTHMIPAKNIANTDWESFWASYSFGL